MKNLILRKEVRIRNGSATECKETETAGISDVFISKIWRGEGGRSPPSQNGIPTE